VPTSLSISHVSRIAKLVLAMGVLVAVAAYLVIVDLGVNAGRIHYGVSVEDVYVGGLTPPEAVARLTELGELLKTTTVQFSAPGASCPFIPEDLGWGPQPADTTKAAMDVGRAHAPFGALVDRLDSWLGGRRVGWAGAPNPVKVTRFIDDCEARASGAGLELDRGELRYKIRRAIVTWPRRLSFRLPLERPSA
jgi:hypothetical protein